MRLKSQSVNKLCLLVSKHSLITITVWDNTKKYLGPDTNYMTRCDQSNTDNTGDNSDTLVIYLPTWQPRGKCLLSKIVKPNNKFQRTFFNGWLGFYCGQIILDFISDTLHCSVNSQMFNIWYFTMNLSSQAAWWNYTKFKRKEILFSW